MLKNKEFVRQLVVSFILLVIVSVTGIIACGALKKDGISSGIIYKCILVMVICMYMIVIYTLLLNIKRYMKIKELSEYVFKLQDTDSENADEFLKRFQDISNHKEFKLDSYKEGELSILQSEIFKLTRRMAELNEKLLKDKNYLSDSLANISHQLKTPLTSMMVMSDLLNDSELSEEKRKEFTMGIISQLKRIEWLLSALLKMARFDAGTAKMNPAFIELDGVIEKSVSHLLIPIELKNQELLIEKETDIVKAFVDESWLVEALANITKNCMEHTPIGGTIKIQYGQNAIYTYIKIMDNGDGISEEDLPHIFERFFKGKNSSKDSMGIGLALAKQIISLSDGYIEVNSVRDKGTEFLIKLYNGNVV